MTIDLKYNLKLIYNNVYFFIYIKLVRNSIEIKCFK